MVSSMMRIISVLLGRVPCNGNKRSVLRRQSRDTNRNIKRSVYCQIRIVKSNVSCICPSSKTGPINRAVNYFFFNITPSQD